MPVLLPIVGGLPPQDDMALGEFRGRNQVIPHDNGVVVLRKAKARKMTDFPGCIGRPYSDGVQRRIIIVFW